jgi:hypothetical protein
VIRLRLYKARERQRVIDPADLEAAYFAVDPETKPVFEHDGVMVWVSGPDHCRVERRIRGRDLHLVECGTNVLPRARGLEILYTPGAAYRWVHSLDWRWSAGEYLDRDRVEAIVDRALDMEPWAAPDGEIADLIGRLAPDDALSHEYRDLSSPFGEDASLIRDALRCKLVEAPRDWV